MTNDHHRLVDACRGILDAAQRKDPTSSKLIWWKDGRVDLTWEIPTDAEPSIYMRAVLTYGDLFTFYSITGQRPSSFDAGVADKLLDHLDALEKAWGWDILWDQVAKARTA